MKLKVDGQAKEEEKQITLRLEREDDRVSLLAVEESGDDWFLLSFFNNGRVVRHAGISPELGFSLSDADHLNIEDE